MKIKPNERTQVQVRCGGQMHKIEVKKNGALALLSHPFLTTQDRAVNKALITLPLEDRPRCFEVLNAWKELMKRGGASEVGVSGDLPIKLRNVTRQLQTQRGQKRGYYAGQPEENAEEAVKSMVSRGVNRCIREAMMRFMDTVEFPGFYRPQVQAHYDENSVRLSILQRPTKDVNNQQSFDHWVNLRDWFAVYRMGLGRVGPENGSGETAIGVSRKQRVGNQDFVMITTITLQDGKLKVDEKKIDSKHIKRDIPEIKQPEPIIPSYSYQGSFGAR